MELFVGLVASRAPLTVTIPEHRLVGYSESFGSSNSIPSPPFNKKQTICFQYFPFGEQVFQQALVGGFSLSTEFAHSLSGM